MVDNIFIKCNYCNTKMRMRFQMGYFDIPFDFCCPECGVHIHGLRKIVQSPSIKVNNASIITFSLEEPHYYADFSVELPHAKITKFESIEKMACIGFSPFLMTSSLYGNESYIKLIQKMQRFLLFRDSFWPKLTPLYDLFFSGRIDLTQKPFLEISSRFEVENELDAMMALHQSTILGMHSILEDGAFETFIKVAQRITDRETLAKLSSFIVSLGGKAYFKSVSKRLVKIYSRWIKDFEKYIPATMLSLGAAADKFDRETFGIATTSFEDMKSFYADSYELILDYIDVVVGLNNITIRGNHNSFPTNNMGAKGKDHVETFEDYKGLTKYTKTNLLIDYEPFSRTILLNRKVRNAIAHFNYDFDSGNQKIVFTDQYRNKENSVELYLIDLALLCYENMMILAYLDELLYSLQKIQYISEGMRPHIKKP